MSGQQDLSMKEASSVSTWKVAFTHLLLTRPKEQIYGYILDMQGTTMAYIELKKSILRGYLFVLSALQAPPKVVQGLCSTTPRTVLKTRKQLRGHLCAHTHQALKSRGLTYLRKHSRTVWNAPPRRYPAVTEVLLNDSTTSQLHVAEPLLTARIFQLWLWTWNSIIRSLLNQVLIVTHHRSRRNVRETTY